MSKSSTAYSRSDKKSLESLPDIAENNVASKKSKSFGEMLARLKYQLQEAKRELAGIIKDRGEYLRQPRNKFTRQGYEVIEDFLNRAECERLIKLTNFYLRDYTYLIKGNCYLECRRDYRDVDKGVQQIMHAQELDAKLLQLFNARIIEDLFERRIGQEVQLQNITIQVDNIDIHSKRGYHNDCVTPTVYKAFIYLNNVNEYGDGPYTVIPGSHLHTLRKIVNYLYGWFYSMWMHVLSKPTTFNPKDSRELFYSDRQAVSFFGKAGTLIISNQQLAHKGWHKHDKNKRYALICYLVLKKEYSRQPIKLQQPALLRQE